MSNILKSIILAMGILGIVNVMNPVTLTNGIKKTSIADEKKVSNLNLVGKTSEEAKAIIGNEGLAFLLSNNS